MASNWANAGLSAGVGAAAGVAGRAAGMVGAAAKAAALRTHGHLAGAKEELAANLSAASVTAAGAGATLAGATAAKGAAGGGVGGAGAAGAVGAAGGAKADFAEILTASAQRAAGASELLDAMHEAPQRPAAQPSARVLPALKPSAAIGQFSPTPTSPLTAAAPTTPLTATTPTAPATAPATPSANPAATAKSQRYSAKELALLKEQTDAFEAFMIKSILDVAMPEHENPLFGRDAGDAIYRDMHHDALARAMGGGLGLSQILFEHLTSR